MDDPIRRLDQHCLSRRWSALESTSPDRIVAGQPGVASEAVSVLAAQIILVSQGIIALSRLDEPRERLAAIAHSYCETLAL